MAETHLDKFKKLLAELFMFDQADLDFGIYRIMNAKRDETMVPGVGIEPMASLKRRKLLIPGLRKSHTIRKSA